MRKERKREEKMGKGSIRYGKSMEGYQGHNSNMPYALFYLRYMDVNHALSQSDMLHTFFENSLFG